MRKNEYIWQLFVIYSLALSFNIKIQNTDGIRLFILWKRNNSSSAYKFYRQTKKLYQR